jgi:hypothetical protein
MIQLLIQLNKALEKQIKFRIHNDLKFTDRRVLSQALSFLLHPGPQFRETELSHFAAAAITLVFSRSSNSSPFFRTHRATLSINFTSSLEEKMAI